MNIPDKVKVGGLVYDVIITDKIEEESCCALIDLQKCIIKIEKAAPQAMEHNFLHELVHAINSEVSEKDTEFLTMLLHQLIVDNPKIFKGGESQNGKQK